MGAFFMHKNYFVKNKKFWYYVYNIIILSNVSVFNLILNYHEKSTNNCNAVGYKHGRLCTKAKSNRR